MPWSESMECCYCDILKARSAIVLCNWGIQMDA